MLSYSTQLIWTPAPQRQSARIAGGDTSFALVGSLGRWHMRWFLALAALEKICVTHYSDRPRGWLESDGLARLTLLKLRLRPEVLFAGVAQPAAEQIMALHAAAQVQCRISQGVDVEVFHRRRRIAAI